MKRYSIFAVLFLLCFESFSLYATAQSKFKYPDNGVVVSQRDEEPKVSKHSKHSCHGAQNRFHRKGMRRAYRGEGNTPHMGASCDCSTLLRHGTEEELKECEACVLARAQGKGPVSLKVTGKTLPQSQVGNQKKASRYQTLCQKIKAEEASMKEKQSLGLDTSAEEINIRAYKSRLKGLSFRRKTRK